MLIHRIDTVISLEEEDACIICVRLGEGQCVLSFILQYNSERWFGGYRFSYELLLFNALFTFLGLCLLIKRKK